MIKPLRLLLALLIVGSLALNVAAGAMASGILLNGGFEELDPSAKAESWFMDFWNTGSKLALTDQKVRTGNYAAFLQSNKANDIRLIQTVPVEPDTVYRFSGWVATEKVPQGGVGASLCVLGGFVHSGELTGDNDWTLVEVVFRTHETQREVVLGVRLGFYGQTTTGKAYFDDLKLEKITGETFNFQQISPRDPVPNLLGLERPSLASPEAEVDQIQSAVLRFFRYPTWILLFYIMLLGGIWVFHNRVQELSREKTVGESLSAKAVRVLAVISLLSCLARIPLFNKATPFFGGSFLGLGPFDADLGRWLGLGCDLMAAWFIYLLLRPKRPLVAACLAAVYLLLPAPIYNSAHWGLADSGYILMILISCFFLAKNRLEPAVFFSVLACCVNPQGAILTVLLLGYGFHKYGRAKGLANLGLTMAALALALLWLGKGNPAAWLKMIWMRYSSGALADNAGNLITLFSQNAHGFFEQTKIGIPFGFLWLTVFLVAAVWGGYCFKQRKTKAGLLLAFTFISFACANLAPGIDERGFAPALALMLVISGVYKNPALFLGTIILSIAVFFNMYAAVNNLETLSRILYIIGIVNTGLLLALGLRMRLHSGDRPLKRMLLKYVSALRDGLTARLKLQPFPMLKRDWMIVGAIIFCYTIFIFWGLGSRSTPRTGLELDWSFPGVEVVLAEPSDLKDIVIYDAEGSGFLMAYKYVDGVWSTLTPVDCTDYYVLKRIPVSAERVERIRLQPQGNAGHVKEVAFTNLVNEIIPLKSVIDIGSRAEMSPKDHLLFDEQEKMSVNPSYLNSTYFDEIYHGRTAYEFIKGAQVYETTHPPFGKDLLSLGILLFGMNPFGMRFMHAVTGILLILVLFFLGREILATRFGAYATMLLGCLDFMPFVQSRYSTVDTTSVLLISLMFLFAFRFIREHEQGKKIVRPLSTLIFLFVCAGLAIAVKWTAVYGFAGVVFMFFVVKLRRFLAYRRERSQLMATLKYHKAGSSKAKAIRGKADSLARSFWKGDFLPTLLWALVIFLTITPLVYYLTYIPYLKCQGIDEVFSGSAFEAVLANQKGMYDYHSKLVATHPFASSWWSWPFNFKPLWIYSNSYSWPGMKGTIVSMGNPLIWLMGLLAVVVLGYQLLTFKGFSLMHLVFAGYLSLYLPWVLVSRITYIYHYYPPLPFVLVMSAFILEPLWKLGIKGKRLIYGFLIASLALLIIFYPALSGLEVPQGYINILRWFPRDWSF